MKNKTEVGRIEQTFFLFQLFLSFEKSYGVVVLVQVFLCFDIPRRHIFDEKSSTSNLGDEKIIHSPRSTTMLSLRLLSIIRMRTMWRAPIESIKSISAYKMSRMSLEALGVKLCRTKSVENQIFFVLGKINY